MMKVCYYRFKKKRKKLGMKNVLRLGFVICKCERCLMAKMCNFQVQVLFNNQGQ